MRDRRDRERMGARKRIHGMRVDESNRYVGHWSSLHQEEST